jgi:cobalt/nickel transport system permease protein
MHISEGVLSAPVLLAGGGVSLLGTWVGLRRLDYDHLITAATLASAFFVGSLVHVPLGPSSVHLLLNGLLGMILGWAAFPCILVALLLQALLFQFGGITVLGVNTMNVAVPALLCRFLLAGLIRAGGRRAAVAGFLGGAGAVLGTALRAALSVAFTDEGFADAARLIVVAHVPVMLIEGFVTMFAVGALARTHPTILGLGDGFRPAASKEVTPC